MGARSAFARFCPTAWVRRLGRLGAAGRVDQEAPAQVGRVGGLVVRRQAHPAQVAQVLVQARALGPVLALKPACPPARPWQHKVAPVVDALVLAWHLAVDQVVLAWHLAVDQVVRVGQAVVLVQEPVPDPVQGPEAGLKLQHPAQHWMP